MGADSFTFKASDGTSTSTAATVSINVTPQPPVAASQTLTTPFATALSVTLSATSTTQPVTYSVVASPANGTLSGTAPNLTYTPATNFSGTDSFTFQANNGAQSNIATISITVSAPPAPVATSQSVTTAFNTAKPITLTSTGAGIITYSVTLAPTHGTLTGTGANLTFVPANGYNGADSFTFKATNAGGSSTATVSITVLPAPPVVANQAATVVFNTATGITLTASGTGPFTYAVIATPSHGAVTVSGATATYTPTTGYVGADSFTFKANNGTDSNVATVNITVLPAPPVANNLSVPVLYNTPTTFTLGTVVPGTYTWTIVSQPAHGTLSGIAPNLTYTPTASYAGTDSFTYTASNAGGASNVATVTLTIAGGFTWNPASGASLTQTVKVGQAATYNLTLSGYTGATGSVTFTVSGAPIAGTVTPNPGTLNGTTPIPVTVTMNTATGTVPAAMGGSIMPRTGGGWTILAINLAGLTVLLTLTRKRRKLLQRLAVALIAVGVMVGTAGCGEIMHPAFATPVGTYTVVVTATAGTVTSSQSLTLIVTN